MHLHMFWMFNIFLPNSLFYVYWSIFSISICSILLLLHLLYQILNLSDCVWKIVSCNNIDNVPKLKLAVDRRLWEPFHLQAIFYCKKLIHISTKSQIYRISVQLEKHLSSRRCVLLMKLFVNLTHFKQIHNEFCAKELRNISIIGSVKAQQSHNKALIRRCFGSHEKKT